MTDLIQEQLRPKAERGPEAQLDEIRRELALKDAIVQSACDPIFLLNPDGTIFDANNAACEIFGYREKSLIGRDFSERILAPIFQESFHLSFGRLVATDGGPLANRKIEVSGIRGDRTEIPIELLIRPVRVLERAQYVAHVRDISESRKTENLLRESESRFRRIFDSNMTGAFFWDFQGNILEANDCFLKLLGYSRKDVAAGSLRWKDIAPPDADRIERLTMEDLQRKGTTGPYEVDYIHKNGRRIPVLFTAALLESTRTRGVTIFMDISSSREGSRDLEETNARLMALLDHLPMVAWVKGQEREFHFSNKMFTKSFGLTSGEMHGKSGVELDLPMAEAHHASDEKILLTGEPDVFQTDCEIAGATRSYEFHKAALRGAEGDIRGILGIGLDITEKQRLEGENKASHEQLRTVSDGVVEAVLIHDRNGKATFANRSATLLFRATDWESMRAGLQWLGMDGKIFPESRRPEIRVLAGRNESEALLRIKSPGDSDGSSERWLVQKSIALRDADGALTGVLSIFRDVTEIRRLEDLNQQQTTAIRASMDGLAILNAAGEFLYVNEAHLSLFGYLPGEILGKPWHILYDTAERNWIEEEVLPKFWSLGSWRGEVVGRKKNGTRFYLEASMAATGTGGLVCAARDITAEKKRESRQNLFDELGKLGDSLEYRGTLSAIARVTSEYLADACTIDLLSGPDTLDRVALEHRDSNKRSQLSAVLGDGIIPLENCPFVAQAIRTGKPVYVPENSEKDFSGTGTGLEIRSLMAVPLMVRGRALGAITFARWSEPLYDLADLSVAEEIARRAGIGVELARQSEKAQNALNSLDDFLGVLGHDLKNPLSAILLNASFLLRGLDRQSDLSDRERHVQQQLRNLERSALRMNQQLSDFLDLARIESGRFLLDRHEYKVARLIQEALEDIAPVAAAKSQKIETSFQFGRETAFFDRERMTQVLMALLNNAIRFSPERGTIRLAIEQTPEALVFSVEDCGPDSRDERSDHLFERFRELKSQQRISQGIGLPLAKGIVEAHGGKLWVETKTGQGSAFRFTLPLQDSDLTH